VTLNVNDEIPVYKIMLTLIYFCRSSKLDTRKIGPVFYTNWVVNEDLKRRV